MGTTEDSPSMEYIKLRRCKLGELCWVATVSRPNIRASLARVALRINALCGSDVYRIGELVRVAKEWQPATALMYASSSHPWKSLGRDDRSQAALPKRGEEVHGGSMTMEGWSGAGYGDQSTEGKCRLGYEIGLMPSTLKGPCRILQ